MHPPARSPFSLIQEDLWPDKWMTLVACQMLNCTTRRQVERVLPEFAKRWPTAETLLKADPLTVGDTVSSLGFRTRRVKNLMAMAKVYSEGNWSDVRAIPGCGEYAGRTHDIFFKNDLGNCEPADHALTRYWRWAVKRRDLSC